ncbi:phosphatase PAP2 family protein [Bacteroides sp. OttesenSCG-928-J23]|nr:phosphatase PAP2 family protein [Bacteroides sp. OttesenSCG-928-J23]
MGGDLLKRQYYVTALVLAVVFSLVAAAVMSGVAEPVEVAVYRALEGVMSPGMTMFMQGVTALCDPLSVAACCLMLLAVPKTRRTLGVPVAASAAGAAGLNLLIKHLFLRPRPELLRLVAETGYSFPSSHSVTSAAVAAVLALAALRRGRSPGLAALWAAYPLLVGISRVYLGVHHAGDVLAGWLLGPIIGMAVTAAWELVQERRKPDRV